jgi:hypothetical protein
MMGTTQLDITQLAAKVDQLVKQLAAIAPRHWKGNCPPDPHHFDAGSIQADASLDAVAKTVTLRFRFTDGGAPHEVAATMRWDQIGIRGGADVVTVDGVQLSGADCVIGHREGLEGLHWYARIVCEFRGTLPTGAPVRYRFDGDL